MTSRADESKRTQGTGRTQRRVAACVAMAALLASLIVSGAATASTHGTDFDPTAHASVVGGHNATVKEYPSLAYIEGLQATSGYACTGTVVAPRVILTAGHCVEDIESSSIVQPEEIAVATGVSNLRKIKPQQVSQVSQVLAFPSFNPVKLRGDAGLLILTEPISAPPIALATKADAALYEPGDELTIAGWGIDEPATEHAPNQLQAATVPVEEASRCKRQLSSFYLFFQPSRQVCALDTATSKITTCHGDSGGPAIAINPEGIPIEVGVTSLGDGTCSPKSPAVFTRTDSIDDWVQQWIAAVETGAPAPKVVVPKAHIPFLTPERAEELSGIVLEEALGSRFTHGQEQTISCKRMAKGRLKCGVTWFLGPNDYFGTTTAFFSIHQNVVLAGVHFNVGWVNDHCYFHSGEPKSCQIHTKRG